MAWRVSRRWPVPGPLLAAELDALGRALHEPARPMVAVVGGAKVSSKLTVLDALVQKGGPAGGRRRDCQYLYRGGRPRASASRLFEPDLVGEARRLIDSDADIPIPTDVVVATAFDANAHRRPSNLWIRWPTTS